MAAHQEHVSKPLTPPCLKRYTNCPFDASGHRYLANECRVCEPNRDECEAQRMACKVMKAYEAQPIHGEALVLPNGVCVAKDVWALKLSDDLFELLGCADPLAAVKRFDLERWLERIIAKLGTAEQMAQFKELVAELERLDSGHHGGGAHPHGQMLPSDLGDVVHQPYLEVDAVRRIVPHLEACSVGDGDDGAYRSLDHIDLSGGAAGDGGAGIGGDDDHPAVSGAGAAEDDGDDGDDGDDDDDQQTVAPASDRA